jgi:hypothetical protein
MVVDGKVKAKEDVPCRWTGSGEGQTWWPAVVADTWDIDKCKDTWSDRVDRVKMADVQVEQAALEDLAAGRSRTAVTRVGVRGTRTRYATRGPI